MSSRFPRAAVVTASLVGLAARTTTAEGNPIPDRVNSTDTSTSEAPTGDELPSDGAPKVENPVDATHFEQNSCDALTPEQANGLNVAPEGTRSDTSFGPGCAWRNAETGGNFHFGILTETKRGLSDTYRANKNGKFTYFEPIAGLAGSPAVAFDTDEKNPTIQCSVVVGLTDQLTIQTLTQLSRANVGQTDPCEVAIMATGEAMKTIKAGS